MSHPQPTVQVPRFLLRRAARILDREARQLHDSYTQPSTGIFECPAAQRDHDHYRATAKALRAAAGTP